MTRLSYHEWNQLDNLIGKHGFGGYYDLIECLKDVATHLGIGNTGLDLCDPDTKVDLPQMVAYLRDWAYLLSNTPGFPEFSEKCADGVTIEKS